MKAKLVATVVTVAALSTVAYLVVPELMPEACACVKKSQVAAYEVRELAAAYPLWREAHPTQACPASLDELREYSPELDTRDPWGHDYHMRCGDQAKDIPGGFGVMSGGPDWVPFDGDDVRSW